MRILVTGACGNIGSHTLPELIARGHKLASFGTRDPATIRKPTKLGSQVEYFRGDIWDPSTLKLAVKKRDVVVHLAAVILPESEKDPDLTRKVNVTGTQTLVDIMTDLNPQPRLIFTSSVSVFGDTLKLPPPRSVKDPLNPIDTYSKTKVECERIIHKSGLKAVILRLGAAPSPYNNKMDPTMFEIRLDTRMEFVHPADVARAIANAIDSEKAWGKTFLIGGGKDCQMHYRDFVGGILNTAGIGALPDSAYGKSPLCTDWLDTEESQRVLNYQQLKFSDWLREKKGALGSKVFLARMFRGSARRSVLKSSPYWKKAQERKRKR